MAKNGPNKYQLNSTIHSRHTCEGTLVSSYVMDLFNTSCHPREGGKNTSGMYFHVSHKVVSIKDDTNNRKRQLNHTPKIT